MIAYDVIEAFTVARESIHDDRVVDDVYAAIVVEIEDYPGLELIINTQESAGDKLEYYKKMYNPDGTHKHAPGIRIVAVFFADDIYGIVAQYNEAHKKWLNEKVEKLHAEAE